MDFVGSLSNELLTSTMNNETQSLFIVQRNKLTKIHPNQKILMCLTLTVANVCHY